MLMEKYIVTHLKTTDFAIVYVTNRKSVFKELTEYTEIPSTKELLTRGINEEDHKSQ